MKALSFLRTCGEWKVRSSKYYKMVKVIQRMKEDKRANVFGTCIQKQR